MNNNKEAETEPKPKENKVDPTVPSKNDKNVNGYFNGTSLLILSRWLCEWQNQPMFELKRTAATFDEAKKAAAEFVNLPLTNCAAGLTVNLSLNSLGKMLSDSAAGKSVSPQLHSLAVANLDVLFEYAPLMFTHPDTKGDVNVRQMHRLGTVLLADGKHWPVKITVKESNNPGQRNRLYSVEVMDAAAKKKPAGNRADIQASSNRHAPQADFDEKVRQLAQVVNAKYAKNSCW